APALLRPIVALTGHRQQIDPDLDDRFAEPRAFRGAIHAGGLRRDLAGDAGFLERFLGGIGGERQMALGIALWDAPTPRPAGADEQDLDALGTDAIRHDARLDPRLALLSVTEAEEGSARQQRFNPF